MAERYRIVECSGRITRFATDWAETLTLNDELQVKLLTELIPGEATFLTLHGNFVTKEDRRREYIKCLVDPDSKQLVVSRVSPVRYGWSAGSALTGGLSEAYEEAARQVWNTDEVIQHLQSRLADAQGEIRKLTESRHNGGERTSEVLPPGVGNRVPDTSLPSKTGSWFINDVVTYAGGKLVWLYTPDADFSNKTDETHLRVNAGSSWYADGVGVVWSPQEVNQDEYAPAVIGSPVTSLMTGSICETGQGRLWFASVQTVADDSGTAILKAESSAQGDLADSVGKKYGYRVVLKLARGRDPRVIINGSGLLMIVSTEQGVQFYTCPDLNGNDWQKYGAEALTGLDLGLLECPQYLPSFNGRQALLFGGNGYKQKAGTGTYLVYGALDPNRGFVSSGAPVRVNYGPDFYAALLYQPARQAEWRIAAWVGSWNYSPDLMRKLSWGEIVDFPCTFTCRGLAPSSDSHAQYPARLTHENITLTQDYSWLGFRQVPTNCRMTLSSPADWQEGEYMELSTGGADTIRLERTKTGWKMNRGDATASPFYDLGDWAISFELPMPLTPEQDRFDTPVSLSWRLTQNSLTVTVSGGSGPAAVGTMIINRPSDNYMVQTHFNWKIDPNSKQVIWQDKIAGASMVLDYVPEDVRPFGGLTLRQAKGLFLSSGLNVVQTFNNDDEIQVVQLTMKKATGELLARPVYSHELKDAVPFPGYSQLKHAVDAGTGDFIRTVSTSGTDNTRINLLTINPDTGGLTAVDDGGADKTAPVTHHIEPGDAITSVEVIQ